MKEKDTTTTNIKSYMANVSPIKKPANWFALALTYELTGIRIFEYWIP